MFVDENKTMENNETGETRYHNYLERKDNVMLSIGQPQNIFCQQTYFYKILTRYIKF